MSNRYKKVLFFMTFSIFAGVQLNVVEERERTGEHARLQFEPSDSMEVPLHAEDRHFDRAHAEVFKKKLIWVYCCALCVRCVFYTVSYMN